MKDILDEANDEYKYNRAVDLFRQALPYIIFLTSIIATIIAVNSYLNSKKLKESELRSELYINVLEYAKSDKNKMQILKELSESKDIIAIFAKLRVAREKLTSDPQSSVEIYKSIINDKNTSLVIKNFTSIELANILINKPELNKDDIAQINSYLIAINEKSPFFMHSILALTLLNYKIENKEQVKTYLDILENNPKTNDFFKDQAKIIEFNFNRKNS